MSRQMKGFTILLLRGIDNHPHRVGDVSRSAWSALFGLFIFVMDNTSDGWLHSLLRIAFLRILAVFFFWAFEMFEYGFSQYPANPLT